MSKHDMLETQHDQEAVMTRPSRTSALRAPIRFVIRRCSLGMALVAASDKGVCCILLGSDVSHLHRDLARRFPDAELIVGDAAFAQTLAPVFVCLDTPDAECTIALDMGGTAFQQRVWRQLRRIPPGRTVSYADLARRIGMPSGARAVARACAANAIAVAVPCHRVVRSDGGLSGYRWGVARKRALLAREAAS
jgi:AraC family transcriptional regulator of adaptative response/methylated-DNA-[protein]-cysteine methyltransferase